MAVSQIEEKILGRIASQLEPTDPFLSASLFQVLGLSIVLSQRLLKARRQRRKYTGKEPQTLQLHHHIIWLAREGLSITEAQILHECQDGRHGAESRVLAAKLRASLYHVFCLFHNHPSVSHFSTRSPASASSTSPNSAPSSLEGSAHSRHTSGKTRSRDAKETATDGRRKGTSTLRDPVLSVTSDASYVTNPYAPQKSPPMTSMGSHEAHRHTPPRPPGLAPLNISKAQAAASFLLPPLDFVPMTRSYFDTAQQLADALLPPTHPLRMSISLEHAAFLWDCCKETHQARHLARKTMRAVMASTEMLDDDEFAEVSALMQALGGLVRRADTGGSPESGSVATTKSRDSRQQQLKDSQYQQQQQQSDLQQRQLQRKQQDYQQTQQHQRGAYPQQQRHHLQATRQPPVSAPLIDRSVALSPPERRNGHASPSRTIPTIRTPERLSTVPEVESREGSSGNVTPAPTGAASPTTSPASSRSRSRRVTTVTTASPVASASASSEKANKRRAVERAEEEQRSRQQQHQHQHQQQQRHRYDSSGVSASRTSPSPSNTSRSGDVAYQLQTQQRQSPQQYQRPQQSQRQSQRAPQPSQIPQLKQSAQSQQQQRRYQSTIQPAKPQPNGRHLHSTPTAPSQPQGYVSPKSRRQSTCNGGNA